MPLEPTGPNAEQIRFWTDVGGPRFIAFQRVLDEQLERLGERAMDRAPVARGDRVLDVGCGCGHTTLALAARVGPAGAVTGVDVAASMLAVAEQAARQAGVRNVRFENADAQVHGFAPASLDVVYSRFGVMFFADPVAAFANLRRALQPAGRVGFVCWQAVDQNPWMSVPMRAAAQHVPLPRPSSPEAPGPFSFADPGRVRAVLDGAGFRRVEIEEVREPLTIGGAGAGLDEIVEFSLQMGPTGSALRDADPALRPVVAAAVRAALAPLVGARGLEMPSASWLVAARA